MFPFIKTIRSTPRPLNSRFFSNSPSSCLSCNVCTNSACSFAAQESPRAPRTSKVPGPVQGGSSDLESSAALARKRYNFLFTNGLNCVRLRELDDRFAELLHAEEEFPPQLPVVKDLYADFYKEMTELTKNVVCGSCGCIGHHLGDFTSVSVNDATLHHLRVDPSLVPFDFKTGITTLDKSHIMIDPNGIIDEVSLYICHSCGKCLQAETLLPGSLANYRWIGTKLPRSALEFEIQGEVVSAFLKANALSHSLTLKVGQEAIENIKHKVKYGPPPDQADFRWPVEESALKLVSKVDLENDFIPIWNEDTEEKMTPDDVEEGSSIMVKFTPILYLGKKAKGSDTGFASGLTLRLNAIHVLTKGQGFANLTFESPSKRQKVRESGFGV